MEQVGAGDVRGSHFQRRRTKTFVAHLIDVYQTVQVIGPSWVDTQWNALDNMTTNTSLTLQR